MCVCVCVCVSTLTSTDGGAETQGEAAALGELLPEGLAHVVVHIVGTQQLLEGLGGLAQVLRQQLAQAAALTRPLAQRAQLSGLRLDQRVEAPEESTQTESGCLSAIEDGLSTLSLVLLLRASHIQSSPPACAAFTARHHPVNTLPGELRGLCRCPDDVVKTELRRCLNWLK